MNHPSIRRSFYGLAASGVLLVAGGTISLVASARQSSPSPSQAKKATQTVPTPPAGKSVSLPGLDKPVGSQAAAPAPGDPQKQPHLDLYDPDTSEKTGLAKGKNFVYTENDMKFTGMTAVYNKNKKELDAQGSLVLDDTKHHLTGDKSHVETSNKLAIITGNVVITLKPAPPDPNVPDNPDRAKQQKFPVIITCDRADDSYKKEFIVLTGHLIFKQTIVKDNGKTVERTLTAEHGEYDGKADKLHLFQPVKAYDSENQRSDFEKDVFVGTKEGEETLTSTGKMSVTFNPDETADDDATPEADKTPTDKQKGQKPPEKKDTPPPTPKQPN